jgi:hypothetical protein
LKQLSEHLEIVLKIFGIIGGFVAGLIFIRRHWHTYKAKVNGSFNGNWSNGGNHVTNPTHYLDVEIYGSDNEIKGRVNVRKWNENDNWCNASLLGKRTFKLIKCQIVDTNVGGKNVLGTVSFNIKKKYLCWTIKHQDSDIFPKKELLHKDLPKVF